MQNQTNSTGGSDRSKGLSNDPELEEKVRQMLDPSLSSPKKAPFEVIKEDTPGTAPVVDGSLKAPIKIELKDEKPKASPEPTQPDEDPVVSKAVDEIQATESDELLKQQDEELAKAFDNKQPTARQKLKNFFADLWRNKRKRRMVLISIALILTALFTVPQSRYYVLNNFGVRSAASIRVIDESTKQPLRGVSVSLRDVQALTDENGEARFEHLKLGETEIKIEKRAFAPRSNYVTLGWGSNPLGEFDLEPVGVQYAFLVTDFLSGKPVEKAEAISGEYSAFSDQDGKILLTVDKAEDDDLEVRVGKDEYRSEDMVIKLEDTGEQKVALAPATPHVFISKRSGQYDVYKIEADGKNEAVILKGTGSERDDMVLVPHPTQQVVALVSTRGDARNNGGYLLSTLTLLDLSGEVETDELTQSERIQVIDWIGDRLVYVKITAGASASKPDRHQLISYDYQTGESTEIARSNYFNDVIVVGDDIYYASSSAYQDKPVALTRVQADGSNRQAIMNQETWNLYRISYDRLVLSVGQNWYEYDLEAGGYSKLEGEPADLTSRVYSLSPDGQKSLWVDNRDGKGVLLIYDHKTGKDRVLHSQSGLKSPVRWLSNNTAVFRVETESETADYAVSLEGGEPKKIRDVTATAGIERWYYY